MSERHPHDPVVLLVTCEHGGNRIPRRYGSLFEGEEALLESHRAWDPGALSLARAFAYRHRAPLRFSIISRLLVDLNRSPNHPRLFSDLTRTLALRERGEILRRWYRPYRRRVSALVAGTLQSPGRVLHLSVHTFTPVLDGKERQVEIGLLYDPAREGEAALCRSWRLNLESCFSHARLSVRVRCNQPYLGRSDGMTTWLRRRWPPDRYLGIELEVSQGLIATGGSRWQVARDALLETLPLAPPGVSRTDAKLAYTTLVN